MMIDVGGYKLNVQVSGAGAPTIVLDAGAGAGVAAWSLVQPELAKLARVCSYDRAGIGASETGRMPRSAEVIVGELLRVLEVANLAPPYVVVGHSQGCFHARLLAATVPDQIAAIVLIEPSHEDANTRLGEAYQQARAAKQQALAGLETKLGMMKVVARLRLMPRWARLSIGAMSARDIATGNAERAVLDETYAQLRARARSHGDVPLVVVAAERSVACFEPRDFPPGGADVIRPAWIELLRDLAGRSSRGELRMVPDCGHLVPLERPGAVVDAVREALRAAQARGATRAWP